MMFNNEEGSRKEQWTYLTGTGKKTVITFKPFSFISLLIRDCVLDFLSKPILGVFLKHVNM